MFYRFITEKQFKEYSLETCVVAMWVKPLISRPVHRITACQFKCWLLCLCFNFLLMFLGGSGKMEQVCSFLLSMWDTRIHFLTPGFILVHFSDWPFVELATGRSLSFSLFYFFFSLPPPFSLTLPCLSNKQQTNK